MTPDELRIILETYAMTQAQLAGYLGVSRRAVVFWLSGERSISRPVELAIRDMAGRLHRINAPLSQPGAG